ncbi:MAG: MerR family transcriptional regulator [Clostridia bacterium]|nr:MerR family transcriptional regulator [Clostridia bacterium]
MKYRVGEIASMLGLSISALRFFEDRGLISPTRSAQNGYRLYEPIDLNRFLRIKTYAQCGFSLEEIAELLRQEDMAMLSEAYHAKADALEKEIDRKRFLLGYIRDMEGEFLYARRHIGSWALRPRPAMYCFAFRTHNEIVEDKACHQLISRWTQWKPFSQSLTLIEQKGTGYEFSHPCYGMLMEEKYAGQFPVEENQYVTRYPAHPHCAFAVFERKTRGEDNLSLWMQRLTADLRTHGHCPCGDIIGRVMHTGAENNEDMYYSMEFWIPLEDA